MENNNKKIGNKLVMIWEECSQIPVDQKMFRS